MCGKRRMRDESRAEPKWMRADYRRAPGQVVALIRSGFAGPMQGDIFIQWRKRPEEAGLSSPPPPRPPAGRPAAQDTGSDSLACTQQGAGNHANRCKCKWR